MGAAKEGREKKQKKIVSSGCITAEDLGMEAETALDRWIAEYRAKRPGLRVLQQRVDEWLADYDKKEEQKKRDRDAKAAEDDGWTLVVGKGGRKKTTDAKSGIAVGAVALEVAQRSAAKAAKKKDSAFDFYRFQHREARRNELLDLQKRYEEDKKKVAKLRDQRKFRPY